MKLLPLCAFSLLSTSVMAQSVAPADWGDYLTNKSMNGSNRDAGDLFGNEVGVGGNFAVVGSPADETGGTFGGSAYVYGRNTGGPGNWGELHRLTGTTESGARFGEAVAAGGGIVAVGAPFEDVTFSNNGAVYIFDAATGALIARVPNPNGIGTQFGQSVATDGTTIAVGASTRLSTPPFSFVGEVWLLDNQGNVLRSLAPSDNAIGSFGHSVDVDGSTCIVGNPFAPITAGSAIGAAYAYDVGTGNELWKLQVTSSSTSFGFDVAVDGGRALVAAPQGSRGEVYQVDVLTGLVTTSYTEGSGYGFSVAMDDGYGYVGQPGYSPPGQFRGLVHQLDLDYGYEMAQYSHQTDIDNNLLGESVAADGGTIFSGGTSTSGTNGLFAGSAHEIRRAGLGLGTDIFNAIPTDAITFRVRGGAPGALAGIAVIEWNGAPFVSIIDIGVFDGNGEYVYVRNGVPQNYAGSNGVFIGGGVSKGGFFTLTNTRQIYWF